MTRCDIPRSCAVHAACSPAGPAPTIRRSSLCSTRFSPALQAARRQEFVAGAQAVEGIPAADVLFDRVPRHSRTLTGGQDTVPIQVAFPDGCHDRPLFRHDFPVLQVNDGHAPSRAFEDPYRIDSGMHGPVDIHLQCKVHASLQEKYVVQSALARPDTLEFVRMVVIAEPDTRRFQLCNHRGGILQKLRISPGALLSIHPWKAADSRIVAVQRLMERNLGVGSLRQVVPAPMGGDALEAIVVQHLARRLYGHLGAVAVHCADGGELYRLIADCAHLVQAGGQFGSGLCKIPQGVHLHGQFRYHLVLLSGASPPRCERGSKGRADSLRACLPLMDAPPAGENGTALRSDDVRYLFRESRLIPGSALFPCGRWGLRPGRFQLMGG